VRLEKNFGGIPAGAEMLVSTPREVDAFLRQVPSGRLVTLDEIRNKLASKHGVVGACPMSTAMFLRIACEAAWEQIDQGRDPRRGNSVLAGGAARFTASQETLLWRGFRAEDADAGRDRKPGHRPAPALTGPLPAKL
jgi:hypothetical protein